MYYRRKILLALLEAFDDRLEKISLQKLLMLLSKLQQKPDFHFVPYKYGCFSFQANTDLATMIKYNQVAMEGNCWVKMDNEKYLLSMKYGFSKSQLQKACVGVGIKYVHIPDLGIDSNKRQELNSQADYDKLFASYRSDILPQTMDLPKKLLSLLIEEKRIALTCFEANICQCHRKHLADAIVKLPEFRYELKHI